MPATAEEEWTYWDEKATELRRTQIATVQSAAAKWSALLTALLGLFGTVAFAGGLTTIDKLSDPFDLIARIMTTLAAVCAVRAIWLLTKAGGGLSLSKMPGINAASVRDHYTTGTTTSINRLAEGKTWAIGAGALVLAGSLMVLWAGERSDPAKAPSVVGIVDGKLVCGKLTKNDSGNIAIGGTTGEVTQVTPVTTCP